MNSFFLDGSALAKRYVPESARRWWMSFWIPSRNNVSTSSTSVVRK
jgi:hypothetical protein